MTSPRALPLLLAIMLAGCGSLPVPTTAVTPPAPTGGTLRIGVDALARVRLYADPPPFETLLDPQFISYLGVVDMQLLRCCMHRMLYSYSGLTAEQGGGELRPDLALALPDVSDGGRRWRIRLRPGLHYAPPFEEVEIRAQDFVLALERLFTKFGRNTDGDWIEVTDEQGLRWKRIGTGSADLLSVIEGADEFSDGMAQTIAGVTAPDAHTLEFTLTDSVGDFAERLATPALSPIPAGVWTRDDPLANYSPFQISSGPYMIAGLDQLDYSMQPSERPLPAGWAVGDHVRLVRNPSWDADTDPVRWALPDEIVLVSMTADEVTPEQLEGLNRQLVDALAEGEVDVPIVGGWLWDSVAETAAATYSVERLLVQYLYFNLAAPPFDDIQVRRAAALAIDRAAHVALFAPTWAPASRLTPDILSGGLLSDYDPFRTDGNRGDLTLAKEAMKASGYDADGDGVCDDPACQELLFRAPVFDDVELEGATQIIERLGEIGLELELRPWQNDFYRHPSEFPALSSAAWYADYPSASNFLGQQFGGEWHPSLIGSTADQLEEWGYPVTSVPDVSGRLRDCLARHGSDGRGCWARLEQHLLEEVVAQLPLMQSRALFAVGPRVSTFHLDPTLGVPTFDKIGLTSGEPAP